MPREVVIQSGRPRQDAINYITDNGKNTLVVQSFLNAARPSGEDAMPVHIAMASHSTETGEYPIAKIGIKGYVKETNKGFTIRDDFDFANPGETGKGYHVNASLGHEPPRAYCGQVDGYLGYQQRVQMTGERCLYDGEAKAADWYVNSVNPNQAKLLPAKVKMAPSTAAVRHNTLPTSQVPVGYYEHEFLNTAPIQSPPLNPSLPSPPPSTRTNVELNLSVLKRYLPATKSILLIAPYAALYTFQPSAEQWEKSSIQGTLFIVYLESLPLGPDRYAIIILNRLGLENFILELQPGADVDLEEEIVVVRGGAEDGMIWGLWIFEEGENKSTAGMRSEVERVVRSCVEASRGVEEDDGHGSVPGEENSYTYGNGDYVNGTHVSPIDSPLQQPQDQSVLRSVPDLNPALPRSQPLASQGGHDILGALFHRAMLNYRGS